MKHLPAADATMADASGRNYGICRPTIEWAGDPKLWFVYQVETIFPYDPVTTERAEMWRNEMARVAIRRGTSDVSRQKSYSHEGSSHHTPTPPSKVQGGEDIV